MLNLSCLCGNVSLVLARRPDHVHECNCRLCVRSGAWWSTFHPDEVTVSGETASYVRADKAEPNAELHFCPRCGSTTHFVLTPSAVARHGNTLMGANMHLADEGELAGIELRFPDGRNWEGAGAFGYVRPPRVFGAEPA